MHKRLDHIDDAALAVAAANGDQRAFAKLVNRHTSAVLRLVSRFCHEPAGMEAIATVRRTLDVAAADFVKFTGDYLASQQKKLQEEIAKGLPAEALQERLNKIDAAVDIVTSGTAIRISNYRGQLNRDPHQIEEAIKNFTTLDQAVEAIRTKTREEINLRQLTGIREASQKYRQALIDVLDNFKAIQEINAKRIDAANAVQQAAADTARAGMPPPGRRGQGLAIP